MLKTLFALNMRALASGLLKRGPKAKAGKLKTGLFLLLFIYVAAALMFSFGTMFYSLLKPFYEAGIGWMYFALFALISFGLCVLGTIFIAAGQLFGAKDNEALLSMPIKPSHILISRVLVLMTVEYLFSLILAVPALALWLWGGYGSALGVVCFVIGFILAPLMAMSLSLLLAWLLSIITTRLRFKNIITLVFSIAFLLGYLYGYMYIQQYWGELVLRGAEIAGAFRRAMPPFYAFGAGVAGASIREMLIFAAWAILPFIAVIALLSARYLQILTTNKGDVKVNYKEKTLKTSGAGLALTKKELAHYWSRPMVILNTSLGSVFMLVAAAALIIKQADILASIQPFLALTDSASLAAMGAVALVVLGSTNNLSASLISLEGKHLWIAKSIPVSPIKILLSKAYAYLLTSSIPCLAASLVMGYVAAENILDWLLLIVMPQTFLVFIAFAGLAINLSLPKLDWTNEVQVVKQSTSTMAGMFGAMALVAGMALLYVFALRGLLTLTAYLWLCTAFFAFAAVGCYGYLKKGGSKKWLVL